MDDLNIAIIVGTTRQGRFGDKPAAWLSRLVEGRAGVRYEIVDLRDYPLPFFDEPVSPAWRSVSNPEAKRFASKMAEFDGYLFVAAEYNHGVSGVLKNALDHLYTEVNRKPASFVGYGGVGAARGIEQLRLIAVELQLAPLRNAVHIGMAEFGPLLKGEKQFGDFPYLEKSATKLFDELEWWARALKIARSGSATT